jgi:FSR family fosmidomycin resistance protein-like MFS transporter
MAVMDDPGPPPPAAGTATVAAAAPARVRPNAPALALLSLGHMVIDMCQGALPALLPVLKARFALSYAAAGTILLAANMTSSLIQPLFGYLSDRVPHRWVLPWSLLLATAGIGLTGLAPSYVAILGLVVLGGLGVAAYHPEGYKTANQVAGDRKATGLSFFSIGGNLGIAFGPPFVTGLVAAFGLGGTLGMLAPGVLAGALILAVLPGLVPPLRAGAAAATADGRRDMPGAMGLLIGVVTVRSWVQLGLTAYVPFLYVDVLGADPRVVGPLLFTFLGAGAVGTLVGGPIADRWGARRYVTASQLVATPLISLFLLRAGHWIAPVFLAAAGFVLVSSFSVTVALGQAYMPRRLGTAAGLVVGFAIGTGGIGVALLGWVADHWGVPAALMATAALPLAGFAVALALPDPGA